MGGAVDWNGAISGSSAVECLPAICRLDFDPHSRAAAVVATMGGGTAATMGDVLGAEEIFAHDT
jgi:hypothetical protein